LINRELPFELRSLIPILDTLSQIFGEKNFEFLLHDFRYPDSSLVYIRGKVTGREVGAPLTDRLWQIYQEQKDEAEDVINVRVRAREGNLINSSTVFVRNKEGKILGSLGINVDISAFQIVVDSLNELIVGITSNNHEGVDFARNVEEFLNDVLDQNLARKPKAYLSKDDRLKIVKELDKQGVFLIKGAVEEVAKRLGVTRFSVYNYLEELRK